MEEFTTTHTPTHHSPFPLGRVWCGFVSGRVMAHLGILHPPTHTVTHSQSSGGAISHSYRASREKKKKLTLPWRVSGRKKLHAKKILCCSHIFARPSFVIAAFCTPAEFRGRRGQCPPHSSLSTPELIFVFFSVNRCHSNRSNESKSRGLFQNSPFFIVCEGKARGCVCGRGVGGKRDAQTPMSKGKCECFLFRDHEQEQRICLYHLAILNKKRPSKEMNFKKVHFC